LLLQKTTDVHTWHGIALSPRETFLPQAAQRVALLDFPVFAFARVAPFASSFSVACSSCD
jgi:hypothetical protein